jgi:hypothetical protein
LPEHVVITDPNIHEPKGASTAAAGAVYVANGSGSGAWAAKLPSQTGNAGKYLTTDGTNESWGSGPFFAKASISNGSSGTQTVGGGAVNIASCTRSGTSTYVITFTSAAPDTNYQIFVQINGPGGVNDKVVHYLGKNTTNFNFTTYRASNSAAAVVDSFDVLVIR